MPISLDNNTAQTLPGGASVTVTVVNNPPADPGHAVHKTWRLQVNNGTQANLNGQPVQAAWNTPTGLLFYEGINDATVPVPDHMWKDISTNIGGGNATGTLNQVPSNPSLLSLAS